MNTFHNILYVTYGTTNETEGLRQAVSLARNNQAPLKVMVICPEFSGGPLDYKTKFEEALLEQATASVHSVKEALKLKSGDVAFAVELAPCKHPSIRIIQQVLRDEHDLVVKESEPHERSEGFKAIDMALLRKCPCPVWLSRPIECPRTEIKVAVAIDPESNNAEAVNLGKRMLQLSRSLADCCNGELQIVSCWDYELEGYLQGNHWIGMDDVEISKAVSQTQAKHSAALQKILVESKISGPQVIHHLRGEPEEKIPDFVKKSGIHVLIMGTVARTGIAGFVIGNTAENIIQKLNCSLIALKPPGFVSPVKAY